MTEKSEKRRKIAFTKTSRVLLRQQLRKKPAVIHNEDNGPGKIEVPRPIRVSR